MTADITKRYEAAQQIARDAGTLALRYFQSFDTLTIDAKGHQDFVSEADKNVEIAVRAAITAAFPDDAIVGEEDAPSPGTTGFTWVIDPIDGTTNFIHGIPAWTVVIALTHQGQTVAGVVHDPVHDEMNHAMRGQGAYCNARPIRALTGRGLNNGSLGIGFSGRTSRVGIENLTRLVLDEGGVFYRNGSGALSLVYVASGKLLGYVEEHMNAWDCLAGQLLVAEAGGRIEDQNADDMIANGGRVVVATAELFDQVVSIADKAYNA